MGFIEKLFGTYSEREVKRLGSVVDKIESLDKSMQKLSDDELRNKTAEFKDRLSKGEASWRVLGIKHFRVQLIGGMVVHQGRIAEMKTGEGKTFVASLPAYLNALAGKGVHVITVNDYLAKTQSELVGKVYGFLGLTTGCIIHGLTPAQRREAYNCDITYGTNNEWLYIKKKEFKEHLTLQ